VLCLNTEIYRENLITSIVLIGFTVFFDNKNNDHNQYILNGLLFLICSILF